jgi:hypothetical protein
VLGFILNATAEKSYGANMFIKTNFDSSRQVYENIRQLHQLASVDRDTVELGKILNISPTEASKLKGFYIQPGTQENKIAAMYSRYRQNLDSISQTEVTYKSYKESLSSYAFPVHQIGVVSTDKFIYKEIEKTFTKELVNNDYLDELSIVNTENLKSEKVALENQVIRTGYLIDEYLKIKISQSQKPESNGTSLYMGDTEAGSSSVNEAELLKEQLKLEVQKREVLRLMVAEKDIISVISGFPSSGYDIREWYEKYIIAIPIATFSITLFVFLLLGLSKFLKAQKENEAI